MKNILVICGPTATGKTSLALYLAKSLASSEGSSPMGELVSADSRQVYKGMDIGTGKDLPQISNFQFPISDLKKEGIGCYEIEGIRLWGYDLVDQKEEFSVEQYIEFADKTIGDIWKRGKLPILVGGTGFYIKGLIDGIGTLGIPKNEWLRKSLESRGVTKLYKLLLHVDSKKAKSMNESDVKNARRLIRAIEVAKYSKNKNDKNVSMARIIDIKKADILFIGLTAPRVYLNKMIEKRVNERLKLGLENEIVNLLKRGVSWDSRSMQSLGYKQWRKYFEKISDSEYKKTNTKDYKVIKKTEKQNAIKEWVKAEQNYTKRQMIWFKKDKRIKWFDISKADWRKDIENTIYKWHNNNIKDQISEVKI